MKFIFISSFILFLDGSLGFRPMRNIQSKVRMAAPIIVDLPSDAMMDLKKIAISGLVSKENDASDGFILNNLFAKSSWQEITAIVDDIPFAKKRLVTPKTVYSGLIDVLKIAPLSDLQTQLSGSDTWLSFNVSSSAIAEQAEIAAKSGLKRVVFAINVDPTESGENVTYDGACKLLSDAGIAYTFIKYTNVQQMGEAKFPYRIVRGIRPLPTLGTMLASEDLMRVVSEVIDLPKTFNSVYGVGPGTNLDSELLMYMKSQGWPERVQVGILMGDMMESLEKKYDEEVTRNKAKAAENAVLPKVISSNELPKEGQAGSIYAGFF